MAQTPIPIGFDRGGPVWCRWNTSPPSKSKNIRNSLTYWFSQKGLTSFLPSISSSHICTLQLFNLFCPHSWEKDSYEDLVQWQNRYFASFQLTFHNFEGAIWITISPANKYDVVISHHHSCVVCPSSPGETKNFAFLPLIFNYGRKQKFWYPSNRKTTYAHCSHKTPKIC